MITATPGHTIPKVLIVNDNETELGSILVGLEAEGFLASGTTDAHSALDLLAQSNFHVVLIDLMIPDLNGLQLARKIRHLFPQIRTMLMSDYLLSPVQLAKADTGAIGFVPKPFHFKEIAGFVKEKINAVSNKSELSPALSPSQVPFDVLSVRYSY